MKWYIPVAVILAAFFVYSMWNVYNAPRYSVSAELAKIDNTVGIGPHQLEAWVLEHGVYDLSYAGECKHNITKCMIDIEKTGYFRGVCSDFSAVFSYLYIKKGFGDPVVAIVETLEGEEHAEVVYFDGYQFFVFYGLPYKRVVEVHYGSEWINTAAQRTARDEFLYNLIKETGRVPNCGDTLKTFAERLNEGKQGKVNPLVLNVGPNVVSILGISQLSVSGSCTLAGDVKNWCPMTPADITVMGTKPGVCHLGDYTLIVKGGD